MARKSRPMGYIFPKRIKDAMRGDSPAKINVSMYHTDDEMKQKLAKEAEQRLDKENLFQEMRNLYVPPTFCPVCSKSMKSLDDKAWKKRGICFECLVRVETHLRVIGKYQQYEEQITLRNYKAYLLDIKEQATEFINNLKDEIKVVNHDGTFDTLKGDQQKVRDFINGEIEDLNKKLAEIEDIDMSKSVFDVLEIELLPLAKELYEKHKEIKEKKLYIKKLIYLYS